MKYTLEQQIQGAELLKVLVEKAWENANFKDQLVKNPITTIENFTSKKFTLPEDKKIVVDDQTDESVIYLNIPPEPNLSELELTEEQLEMIAGGITPTVVVAAYVGGFVLGAGATLLAGYLLS